MAERSTQTTQEALYIILYKLTTTCKTRCLAHLEMQILQENAMKLCHLLINKECIDGANVQSCVVCALDILQRNLIKQMNEQIDAIGKIRNHFYVRESSTFCEAHFPVNLNNNFTLAQFQQPAPPQRGAQFAQIPNQMAPPNYGTGYLRHPPVPPNAPYYPNTYSSSPIPVFHTVPFPDSYDSFVQVPYGEDPFYFMTNYNYWVQYFQQFPGNYRRMRYTKNFASEAPDNFGTGRRF